MNPFSLLITGWLGVAILMAITFRFAWKNDNAGIVDVVWTYSIGLLALYYALAGNVDLGTRQFVVLALVLIWSLRLGTYLLRRVARETEDGRYQALKLAWKDNLKTKLFLFFQMQALADVVLSIAILVTLFNPTPFGTVFDYIGIGIALFALIGESISDSQLKKFREQTRNRGKTCRQGLWKYSRHPNYFFEWAYWWTFPCLAIGADFWLITLLSPICLLYLMLKVTGIPPTEAQALKSRGDDYRAYQKETNAFFPWIRKNQSSNNEHSNV